LTPSSIRAFHHSGTEGFSNAQDSSTEPTKNASFPPQLVVLIALEALVTNYFQPIAAAATFDAEKASKTDLFRGHHLFVGLNCFEPGQSQKIHTHAGSDKFYLVITGKARMIVGDETREVGPGTVVWAPASLPHGVAEVLERTIMVVAMAPPPDAVKRQAAR
jgi:quercetin dioxygenase-like cupin family protein